MSKGLNEGDIVKVNESNKSVRKYLRDGDFYLHREYTIMEVEEIGERFVRIDKSFFWWHPDVFVLVRRVK